MSNSLKNKRVLVTGADGFIGSHLCEELLIQGANVRALNYYNSFNNWGWLESIELKDEIEIISGDVRDTAFCLELTRDMEIVFNLAALIAIPYSYIAPESYIDTNVKGALNMCQAARASGSDRVIQISTSEVYGTAKYVPIDEAHELQPQSPYSASKIGADSIAMSFFYAFELPVTIARPFNVFGPRQSARAVIPTIITQIAAGKKSIALGDLTPTRDFTYVKDTCRALALIAAHDETVGQTINIGSNFEISVHDVVMKIKELMNSDIEIIHDSTRIRPKDSEVFRLWCDNSKIKGLTGFEPEYTLEKGLNETIEWFTKSENLTLYKEGIYNV